jgi:hypothetical protein
MTLNKDAKWMLEEICKAKTIQRLIFIAEVIKSDSVCKYEYADENNLKLLRMAWNERNQQICSDPTNARR